jgi:protein-S-isoprenylcysteine O-methyltransferase Ste14
MSVFWEEILSEQPIVERTKETSGRLGWKAIVGFALYVLLLPAALFISAGTLRWPMGWAYSALLIASVLASRAIALRVNPDLLAERARYRQAEGVKGWDRVLVGLVALYGPLATCIVAGLDERLGWSQVAPALQWIALALVALGFAFAAWAMAANRFFSSVVRIQADRGHAVVSGGPYRYVRHPGYAGGVVSGLVTPLMLGALWALIPAGLTAIGLVVRTALEDKTLHKELSGYIEYAQRTRYRLLPGIW